MIIYYNGKFLPAESAISAFDRGFTLGDGIFDTLLAVNGRLENANEHFQRLLAHAKVLAIDVSYTKAFWQEKVDGLLKANHLHTKTCSVRTTITRGIGLRGLGVSQEKPSLVIQAAKLNPPDFSATIKAEICTITKRNENSPLSKIKSLNYSDNILALLHAQEKGFDDAILLNTKNQVTCSTKANVFIYQGGRLLTPQIEDGVIAGITRQAVIKNFDASEVTLTAHDLLCAESIFLTNSLSKMCILKKINRHPLITKSSLIHSLKCFFTNSYTALNEIRT